MPWFSKDPEETRQSLEHRSKQTFEKRGRDPAAWHHHADALLKAADMLWEQIESDIDEPALTARLGTFGPVAAMLCGLGVEALAKAVRVLQTPGLIANDAFTLKTHKLVELVAATGISLDAKQKSALVQLTGFVEWAGKYPIPLAAEHLTPRLTSDTWGELKGLELAPGTLIVPDDRRVVRQVVERLEALLNPRSNTA